MAATIVRVAPEVPVRDLRQSIEYYEQKLGFEPVMELPDGEYAIVERDGIAIHLFQDAGHVSVGLHLFTGELEELHQELVSRGAQVTQEIERKPWGNRDFRVRDLSGNELKFTEGVDG
ncbi:MAG TPA: VOC family protein [Bryobacteraceae bacterium]|nr:VOC family protein [Bryobacteraceae bacterium]